MYAGDSAEYGERRPADVQGDDRAKAFIWITADDDVRGCGRGRVKFGPDGRPECLYLHL